nr:hypothetical protein JVH1_1010 [Rhodococcus sp. JVH1]
MFEIETDRACAPGPLGLWLTRLTQSHIIVVDKVDAKGG